LSQNLLHLIFENDVYFRESAKDKMRILHLTYRRINNYSDPEVWLKRTNFFVALLEQMAKKATILNIHCINYNGLVKRNGVEYHFLRQNFLQHWLPFALHAYVQSLKPEVIIVHGFANPWQVWLLRSKIGASVPILIQHHSEKGLRHYKRILQKHIDDFIAAYFFPSFEQAESWVEDKLIGNISKVHEVMEVPSVFFPMDKKSSRARTNASGEKVYLWVGRFDENKDPITLVSAFINFTRKNSGVRLYVVFQTQELIEEVNALLKEQPTASQQIILVGKVEHDELLYWFNSADFIISTSRYEGMGVAVCEGMSCGCIPILTEIPSFNKMTGYGRCGILFKTGSIPDLVTALEKSLFLDVEKERERTLAIYKELLSAEAISSRMISVCNQFISV
jgi:glycosyltransferase involved in cell wall biosynthesis